MFPALWRLLILMYRWHCCCPELPLVQHHCWSFSPVCHSGENPGTCSYPLFLLLHTWCWWVYLQFLSSKNQPPSLLSCWQGRASYSEGGWWYLNGDSYLWGKWQWNRADMIYSGQLHKVLHQLPVLRLLPILNTPNCRVTKTSASGTFHCCTGNLRCTR